MGTVTGRAVALRITCLKPPEEGGEPAEFGLQDAREVLQAGEPVEAEGAPGALRFSCEATVRENKQTGALDLRGPFVHGPAGGRFLYLGLRNLRTGAWVRRLKIPLATLTREQIEAAATTPGAALAARVAGTGSGTVPLLGGGWEVQTP